MDKKLKEFDEGLLRGMILTDLQKVFDTINHKVLLQKPKAIRFWEQSLQWFRSYLCDQIFLVEAENKLSDFGKISSGVSQGSILGPLLFLIDINDLPQAVWSNLLLYPDDSCLMHQQEILQKLKKYLIKDFQNICHWFVDNKLRVGNILGMIKLNQFFSEVSKEPKIFIN